jgi:opacity protein-like surface antigen
MKKIFAVVFTLIVCAGQVHAAALAKGTKELRLQGGIDFDAPGGTDIALKLGYGQFVADYIELGGLVGYSDNDFVTTASVGAFLEYNLETETAFIPYVGGQLEAINSDIDVKGADDGFGLSFGMYAGTKFYVTDNLAINGRFIFLAATTDAYLKDGNKGSDTDFTFELGLNFYF